MTSAKVFEDNELPVNLEDLPNFRLKNIESDAFQYVPGQELQTAKKFITDLQTLLMKKKPEPKDRDELLNLYDFSFNKICESVFKTSFWPTPQQIEESDEDLEIDITTQTLYQELCFRHIYARLQNYNADVRTGSWENYKDLFDIILNSKDEINLPVPWIWDILDEFIYQYQTNCQWRSKVKEDDPIYAEIIHSDKDFWNLDVLQNILKSLIEKGKILKSVKQGEFSLDDFGMNLRSSHYFAYFSLVGLLRTHTLLGDFKSALQIIEPIDFKKLIIYSKAYACYISLFFYSGFALIMTGRHREAVKIFEALLSFISKYKQFYSKSFQYDAMHKQADKTLFLLALALVFYPVQIEDSVSNMLKDRLQDKLEKLNKYDVGTFNEVFNFGCPKFINPILNIEHFRTMGFDKNNSEPILVQREALLKEFKKIQNLNNISSVLRLYTRIHLSKAAKVLGTSQDELKELLNLYKKRNQSSSISNPFETTIIKRFVGTSTQIDFVVDKDVIMITEDHATQNYTKMYLRLNQKVDEMVKELDNF